MAMSVKTTSSNAIVECDNCGKEVEKRMSCGVGINGNFTWICVDCILKDSMDRVFAPISKAIREAASDDD